MAQRIPGGRIRIGGVTVSRAENEILQRAARWKNWSRAELMREGGLMFAAELEAERGTPLLKPEEYQGDPDLLEVYLRARTYLQQLRERPPKASPPKPGPSKPKRK